MVITALVLREFTEYVKYGHRSGDGNRALDSRTSEIANFKQISTW
jgi:hypothetical protein